MLQCALAEAQLRPLDGQPVLSIVIPSFHRPQELMQAIGSIAEQLTGGLEHKVEVIVTDNASGPETVAAIKAAAERYPTVSYMLHVRDEGGFFQFFAAPWRARGTWTWVFGSDDILMPGGIAQVVEMLERETPSFATVNKKLYTADLSQEIWAAANSAPDRRFDRFEDLMQAVGINQLAFISSNIELTQAARAIDAEPLLTAPSRHPHVAGFLEKHHGARAFYMSAPFLVHRGNNANGADYHHGNFFDYAVTFPILLNQVLRRIDGPADFMERMNGDKRFQSWDRSGVTFVDNIFENILRFLAGGHAMTVSQRRALEAALTGCRSDRLHQLGEMWQLQEQLAQQQQRIDEATAALAQSRTACAQASQTFTRPTG